MASASDRGTTTVRGIDTAHPNRLCVLVIGETTCATVPLPDSGEVVIGRGRSVDLPIEDASISRRHAALCIGPTIAIEDLGSANGTRVRGAAVAPGNRIAISLGDVIDVGNIMLIVQRRPGAVRARRRWPHEYFEGRLDEQCLRADRTSAGFAVLRVHGPAAPPGAVEDVLAEALRPADVVGIYAPGEYEVLLDGETQPVLAALERRFAERGLAVALGVARYPEDGRSADALLDRAGARVRGADPDAHAAPIVAREGDMAQLQRLVERVARGQINVLVLGETGAGKEVLAETIHRLSPRSAAPFLRLNCAALSETLLESELFGYERGAFTGAVAAKSGLLETAEGGTVFLDEVGELPMTTQVKLLRVLEDRTVLRVGGLKARPIDVRFIAATNRNLAAEVKRGAFRADLFYRLDGVALEVPPLRCRLGEIPDLARAFAAEAARKLDAPEPVITDDALALLQSYSWPGNIRELRNAMERAVLLSRNARIGREQLPLEKMRATVGIVTTSAPAPAPAPAAPAPARPRARRGSAIQGDDIDQLRRQIDDLERERILAALERCGGNQTRAAKLLGMPRRTLVSRLSRYDVPRPRK